MVLSPRWDTTAVSEPQVGHHGWFWESGGTPRLVLSPRKDNTASSEPQKGHYGWFWAAHGTPMEPGCILCLWLELEWLIILVLMLDVVWTPAGGIPDCHCHPLPLAVTLLVVRSLWCFYKKELWCQRCVDTFLTWMRQRYKTQDSLPFTHATTFSLGPLKGKQIAWSTLDKLPIWDNNKSKLTGKRPYVSCSEGNFRADYNLAVCDNNATDCCFVFFNW